jgi:hypothetical protein
MALIIQRNFPNDPDKVINLNDEQMARTMTIGSNWNWIRLGVRMQMSKSNAIVNPNFAMGLCSGTSSLYGDRTTTHFFGQDFDTNAIWTENSVTRAKNWAGLVARFVTKVSSSIINWSSGSQKDWAIGSTPSSNSISRQYYMLDFVKSAVDPGLWMLVYVWNKAADLSATNYDESFTSFYNNMTNLTASLNSADYTSSFQYIPISESINGNLDTLNIYWNQTANTMQLSDVAVFRFA